jgi:hypothetical protein
MTHLSLNDACPGMVLAADVWSADQRLLLGAGAALTTEHLRIFRMWGVRGVEVAGAGAVPPAVPPGIELTPEERRELEERVNWRFRHVDRTHPAMRCLIEVVRRRQMARRDRAGEAR